MRGPSPAAGRGGKGRGQGKAAGRKAAPKATTAQQTATRDSLPGHGERLAGLGFAEAERSSEEEEEVEDDLGYLWSDDEEREVVTRGE